MKKSLNILLIVFILIGNLFVNLNHSFANEDGHLVSGIISQNTTWDDENVPYIVTGNILVDEGVTLTIGKGVQVLSTSSSYIQVRGKLNILGSEESKTKIQLNRYIELLSNENYISNCNFVATSLLIKSDKNTVTNCNISQTKNYSYNGGYEMGGITIINGNTNYIVDSVIEDIDSSESVYVQQSTGNIFMNTIIRNNTTNSGIGGMGIYFNLSNMNQVIRCSISNNEGPGIYLRGSNNVISLTKIFNNRYGIMFYESSYNNINKSIITKNFEWGIRLWNTSNTDVINENVIYNNAKNLYSNVGTGTIDATNNYWGTTSEVEIQNQIFDYFDDFNFNKVNFKPFLENDNILREGENDIIPPDLNQVNEVTDKSTSVTGTAEVGSTITIKEGTTVLGTAVAKGDGTFSVSIVLQKARTKLTVTATDDGGNVSEAKEVTVKDTEKPTINGVIDNIIKVGEAFDVLNGVTANDNVDGDITSNIKVTGTVDVTKPNIYTLTYTVTDTSGNETTVTRKITVIDNVKPVINGATDKSIKLGSTFNPMTGVTATDNFDGNLTTSISVVGTVNTKVKGSYTLRYTVKDLSNNTTTVTRTITVIDTIRPVLSGVTNKTIRLNSAFNPRTGVVATDNYDGNLTSLIKVTGTVNIKIKGVYVLTYQVTDKSGNTTTIKRYITVDNVKPVITGATSKTIKLKSSFNSRTGVTAKDNVDGNLTSLIKVSGTVNTKKKGKYTLTYTVSDKSGNKAVVTRKITVK